jgi:ribonucleoside-diphosphate reductase alpha chain
MIEIKGKIISQKLLKETPKPVDTKITPVVREEALEGYTYKIKSPLHKHALYVTINNRNGRPFEIFLNSKNVDHFQWTTAMTRIISAVMRTTNGHCDFLLEELESVFDPNGGYFGSNPWSKGKYMPSLVAEIGAVIRLHMGLQPKPKEKGKEEAKGPKCKSCGSTNTVLAEGCFKCLDCGDSKCG